MTGIQREFMALHCVGYGLFLLGYCSTVPVLTFVSHVADGWAEMLLVQFSFFAATALGCLFVRRGARGHARPRPVAAHTASSVAICAAFALCALLASPSGPLAIPVALTWLLGLGASYPLVTWFRGLCDIYARCGRRTCIATLAGSGLVAAGADLLATPLRASVWGLAGFLVAAELACTCCRLRVEVLRTRDAAQPKAPEAHRGAYRLTPYSFSVLASLGVTVGLTGGCIVLLFAQDLPSVVGHAVSPGPAVAFAGIAALALCVPEARLPRFGLVARLLISVTGFALALLPLLVEEAPQTTFLLFKVVFSLQGIVMMLFSIEVACENGLSVLDVMPVNYAFYALAACLGALGFWAFQSQAPGHAAWDLVAALGVLATVMVIPMLPATSSSAATFALEELPENESDRQRMDRTRNDLASTLGLTARESEVLGLLMEGRSRAEIAARLGLSGWTVKDYMSSIYQKAQVHSYQELIARVQQETSRS